MVALEIAVQSPAGAAAAFEAGADRVELCSALSVGGLTPSLGLIEAAVAAGRPLGRGVHVLIRPRPGGFVFDAAEIALLERDVRASIAAGAAGVVIGALTPEGDLDEAAVAQLVQAAVDESRGATAATEGPEITFHRALDVVSEPEAMLERLQTLGVHRVLTSGGAERSIDGVEQLERLAAVAGSVQVMAGGGVRPEDIPRLIAAGIDAVHLSARTTVRDRGASGPGGGSADYDVTDAAVVARCAALVSAAR